ncbi:hypothetical protein [Actinoplanes sp. RD1]|uniref:hypothetical protein n=1 Tax=Actinoplanes sp. RD1 TaxID=3064538 RepID=UPI002741E8D9|nr:hypothetical protein [Actinoplanes sp. RD1]
MTSPSRPSRPPTKRARPAPRAGRVSFPPSAPASRAAEEAAAEVLGPWADRLPPDQLPVLRDALARLATPGRLRPTW